MATSADGLKERVDRALRSQEQATVTVLSSLLAVQDELSYIPEEAIDQVASFTNSTLNDVWGVASFYTNFRFSPPGGHYVELCWGSSCHIMGAMQVVKSVLDVVGLRGEGDSSDGKITVRYNTCLGACAQAPVISVDHQLAGRITPEKVRELLSPLLR